jgi:hypothetical protein
MIFSFLPHIPDPAGFYSRSIDFFPREYFRRSCGIESEGWARTSMGKEMKALPRRRQGATGAHLMLL